MAETKTVQKTWSFTPEILSELEVLRTAAMRSQQNMVEVLIHNEYLKGHTPVIDAIVKDRDCEAGK